MPPSAEQWIEAFAAALNRPAPSAEQREAVLKLASVAAHASERRAAPIACWLAAASELSLDEAVVLAQELSGGPDVPDPVSAPDVAIAGGGIVGAALAALLAEAGASVRLYEREAIAAAASGRNSGVLQHPLDEALTAVHERSLELYATLGHGFAYPAEPTGVLVLSDEPEASERERNGLAGRFPEVAPTRLDGADLRAAEPGLGDGLVAYRLETGRPVPPASATHAWAERARAAGADLRIGTAVEAVEIVGGRAAGVRVAGGSEPAGTVVLAAGPWTRDLAPAPVAPLWGVNVEVRLPEPPRHVLEQAGIDALVSTGGASKLFSIVTAGGVSAVGSTFLPDEPDPAELAPLLLERGSRFVPALAEVASFGARACPRPQSADGRPLLGPHRDVKGLHLATGHGPWGISLGPGSAELVAGAILGGGAAIPPELAASRAL